MKLEMECYGALCSLSNFRINDIDADSSDFGEQYDRDRESAEPYACGDMQFTSYPPTQDVLTKYGITTSEYLIVASQLEEVLSFGHCGRCV